MNSATNHSCLRMAVSAFAILLMAKHCKASCEDVGFAETFESSSIVARLTKTGRSFNSPSCSYETVGGDTWNPAGWDYTEANEFPIYAVEEVFKGDLSAGAEIPVIYEDDTSAYFTVYPYGDEILAFLFNGGRLAEFVTCNTATDSSEIEIYALSFCDEHKNWTDVSDEELAILTSNSNSANTSSPVTTAPEKNSVAPTLAPVSTSNPVSSPTGSPSTRDTSEPSSSPSSGPEPTPPSGTTAAGPLSTAKKTLSLTLLVIGSAFVY